MQKTTSKANHTPVLSREETQELLESKYLEFNKPEFTETDPVSIPHLFNHKEDIEIAGFLAATIAWGQRKSILKNAHKLMELMGHSPYEFIMGFEENPKTRGQFNGFAHRTFNGTDCLQFFHCLRHIYTKQGGLEKIFMAKAGEENVYPAICRAREAFFSIPHQSRTQKHFSNPCTGSAAKRISMFLRWMVRKDHIDFGIWKYISPAQLICPLDVHSGNVARKLGLLGRKQNDRRAAEELTRNLSAFCPQDPVKYDIALFGLGVFEKF